MLIHVIPQIHIPRHLGPLDVRLLTIGIPEIGWQRNEEALRVGRPYPNKGYIIGYAAARTRAAVVGLFVETPDFVDRYTVIARWGIAGGVNGDITLTHTVEHTVLDTEYDAVSDLMLLWYGNDTRPSRYPDLYADNPPRADPAGDGPVARFGRRHPSRGRLTRQTRSRRAHCRAPRTILSAHTRARPFRGSIRFRPRSPVSFLSRYTQRASAWVQLNINAGSNTA